MKIFKIQKQYPFSKVGVNEVEGLRDTLHSLALPIKKHLEDSMYWNDNVELRDAEYAGRDGFIPHGHNCGGVQISEIVPRCEFYDFDFLEFGECEGYDGCDHDGSGECPSENDGHLDAIIRVWLKFEGIDANGVMSFYFYAGGGNNDAPYFRQGRESTVFEESFQAINLNQLRKTGSRIVRKMLRKMGAK